MNSRIWKKLTAIGVMLAFIAIGTTMKAEQAVPQFQEKEGVPVYKKHRSFPWLPVLLGVGAITAAVVLLGRKSVGDPSPQMIGSLQVNSIPSGARILLDGRETGLTSNITMDRIKAGTHAVTLTNAGFVDFATTVSVAPGQTTVINAAMTVDLDFAMASIPGGVFEMGSVSGEAYPDEKPVHPVTISPLQMGRYEVTQGQWKAVMGGNPAAYPTGDNYPVETVSWNEVQAFIQKLNAMTGRRYRLPTEAEWEYACRAGGTAERYGESADIAWYNDNSGLQTHPVGLKQPNAFGLYDMQGNVWELCQDWYGPYSSAAQVDPVGPVSGSRLVRRGGSFNSANDCIRAARRNSGLADFRSSGLGFRLVRSNQ